MPTPLRTRPLAAVLMALAALLAGLALLPTQAHASRRQIAMIQDDNLLAANPAGTLSQMQALGATTVRVVLYWNDIAPDISSTHAPKHFDASNPAAYPASNWAPYDTIVRDAAADGMTIDFTVAGATPRWAEGSGIPSNYVYPHNVAAKYFSWKPNAGDFGQFMQAVGRRYSGSYTPAGAAKLPRVHFWAIWNEPNFGEFLGPQATDTSRILAGASMYRNLVRTGYRALQRTGHGHDTILIGELAAHGSALSEGHHGRTFPQGLPGNAAQSQPLPFMRTLYCVGATGHALTGTAAKQVGCPTNASGRHSFRKDNPGLFDVTGVGDHPYANNATPASDGKGNPEWATFPNLPKLESALDSANRAWGSSRRYPIYSDEYGYITDPPQRNKSQSVPAGTAAKYINWAEYLSWNEPRVASYDQYLVDDPAPNPEDGNGGFATGLYSNKGKAKPALNAYRLPLWLPSASLAHAGPDKVWGEARPAYWAGKSAKRTQAVQIQFRAGSGAWTTIDTVHSNTYFEARPRFTRSGSVRLRYTYPSAASDPLLPLSVGGTTIVSRTQSITVK